MMERYIDNLYLLTYTNLLYYYCFFIIIMPQMFMQIHINNKDK